MSATEQILTEQNSELREFNKLLRHHLKLVMKNNDELAAKVSELEKENTELKIWRDVQREFHQQTIKV